MTKDQHFAIEEGLIWAETLLEKSKGFFENHEYKQLEKDIERAFDALAEVEIDEE